MRFAADENVPRLLVQLLRNADFDVLYIAKTDRALSDLEIANLAHTAKGIIITQDQDFGELAIAASVPICGLILLVLDPLSNEGIFQQAQNTTNGSRMSGLSRGHSSHTVTFG
jgi:predicted nuclease of predicted toxin-antitoxin system